MESILDVIIVGSGVSGGRMAQELSEAGLRVLILEAGKEYSAKTFPRTELAYSTQLFWNGGLEISTDGSIGLLRGKCVGGTSVVNQALLDRFDDSAWGDWRSVSGVPYFTRAAMEEHYEKCEAELSISEIDPKFYNRNAKIFTAAMDKCGHGWKPLHRAQGDCALEKGSDCMSCLGGCPRDSKQSALITTLKRARAKGAQLESEVEVNHIEYGDSDVTVKGRHRGQEKSWRASRVVLAAGALGNSAILMRSPIRSKLPALGTRFACHPQFMTYAAFEQPVDAHKGAFQAVKSEDAKLRARGFKLENVFAPPIGTAMLMPGHGRAHLEKMRKYRYYASLEVAIRDEASGQVQVSKDGRLQIHKTLTSSDRSKVRDGMGLVREIFAAAGAREIVPCEQTFGLHLMGGCPIGVNPMTSVVDPDFRVHSHPRITIADSSVFPSAPGINPSFTIMALSHRAAQAMLKDGG